MITSERILKAFMEIPREYFVETSFADQAYADHPLPIGVGQTISQPTTVMLMLQLLKVEPEHRVLEIGAGCGYNAALLAKQRCIRSRHRFQELCVRVRPSAVGASASRWWVVKWSVLLRWAADGPHRPDPQMRSPQNIPLESP